MTIHELDELSLFECCGSTNWVTQMLYARPYYNIADLQTRATDIWRRLDAPDWLEAFSKHPKIGERRRVNEWSSQEQSGMSSAVVAVSNKLAELNQLYFDKFGYIFIVCATGKSAEEMLELLEARLQNATDDELRIAAAEQNKITLLRLEKLLSK
jgi:2-oxo-4-hydroxy-4-carboxy-5-ureidoimidazoline decarboxylase